MKIKYVASALMIIGVAVFFSGCKSTKEITGEQEETVSRRMTLQEEIAGEWRLSGIEEEGVFSSDEEKQDYESYMEALTISFKLDLFSDGTYFRNMLDYSDRGRWRLISGDTELELFSNSPEYRMTYTIKDYNNPRLVLIKTEDGDRTELFLKRAGN